MRFIHEHLEHSAYTMLQLGVISGENLKEIEEDADILLYSIKGKLCYINSRAHVARFETNLNKYKNIIIRLREVYFIDLDGVAALDEIITLIESKGQRALITSASPAITNTLRQLSKKYFQLEKNGLVFNKATAALNYLGVHKTRKQGI